MLPSDVPSAVRERQVFVSSKKFHVHHDMRPREESFVHTLGHVRTVTESRHHAPACGSAHTGFAAVSGTGGYGTGGGQSRVRARRRVSVVTRTEGKSDLSAPRVPAT